MEAYAHLHLRQVVRLSLYIAMQGRRRADMVVARHHTVAVAVAVARRHTAVVVAVLHLVPIRQGRVRARVAAALIQVEETRVADSSF